LETRRKESGCATGFARSLVGKEGLILGRHSIGIKEHMPHVWVAAYVHRQTVSQSLTSQSITVPETVSGDKGITVVLSQESTAKKAREEGKRKTIRVMGVSIN